MQTLWIIVTLLLTAILVYVIAAGIRGYQISGFRFYLVGCSIRSIVIIAAILTVMLRALGTLEHVDGSVVIMGGVCAYLVESWHRVRVRQTSPAEWKSWADKSAQARQASWLDKWLLPVVDGSDLVTLTLPNGRAPKDPSEMMSVISSQFPIVHRFLIGGGIVVLLIGLAISPHPNPYMRSTLVFVGLDNMALGGSLLFASRKRLLSTWLTFLGFILFCIFLYSMVRMFTYSQ